MRKQIHLLSGREKGQSPVSRILTMEDIAKQCGVSKATVSRVLNKPNLVNGQTRLHVQNVLRNSGYIHNSMRLNSPTRPFNHAIGMLIANMSDASFGDIIRSVQAMTAEQDLLFGDTIYSPHLETRLLERMVNRRVSCVVMVDHCIGNAPYVREAEAHGVPCLMLWSKPEEDDLNYIGFDNALAVIQAADYLISLGHKRIGLVVGPYDRTSGAKQRVKGLRNSLLNNNLEINPNYTVMLDIFSPETGRQSMTRLLEISPRPTAVILGSDILAIGAYAAVRRAGLQIPKDISLIALDNIDFAPYMDPPLTTVHIPTHEIGRMAGQYLARLLDGEPAKYQICLPTSLMLRESVAEPPKDEKTTARQHFLL